VTDPHNPPELGPPDLADIDAMARAALLVIPEPLRRFAKDVVLRVDDFPADDVCAEMELESPFDILGLYDGVALDEKDIGASESQPDMVFLYRRPILEYWAETGDDLNHIVRHVLIHEIGHHFGFSDDDMEALEEAAG
jgi:predicted Zn-dependent protease with MMP-like domain